MVSHEDPLELVDMDSQDGSFQVAIVGGGITGLSLAIGLLHRNINFTIYERAHSFAEIGAGIGFTLNAERAMKLLDPRIHAAFRATATQNTEDWYNYVDGYNWSEDKPDDEETILRLYLGERGFEGCRRSDFLQELVQHIPAEHVKFEKDVVGVIDHTDGGKVTLTFRDGTTADADVVIGCDGLRSKTRRLMLGDDHPAARPSYSHKYAIRGLIPMAKAREALGEWRTSTRLMHLGQDAHALTFPIGHGALLNVVAFVTDPNEWPSEDKLTLPALKSEATQGFAKFSPVVKTLMDLLPDQLDKWAVFDTRDNPVPTYVSGRLCLAGDAAHASSPHHGAGAGCGIEDCLALSVLLEAAVSTPFSDRSANIRHALEVYNNVRYERSQWLVDTSRVIGEVYEFQGKDSGSDRSLIAQEIYDRSHKIWDYDVSAMVAVALEQYHEKTHQRKHQQSLFGRRIIALDAGDKPEDNSRFTIANKETSSTDVSVDSTKPEDQSHFLTGIKLAALIGSFTVVMFLMMLDMSILSTAIPYITDDFKSLLDVGWYGATYQLVSASLQPLTGKMYARLNSKLLMISFFAVFEVGSALCGAAQSSLMLILGRAVAGIGGAGLMNGGFTIINSCVTPNQRPAMIGIMMAFGNLGAAMGPLIGGGITQYASWRWCFYINLPAGAILFPFLIWLNIPDSIVKPHWKTVLRHPLTEFDLIGFGLFAPASIMLFIALEFAGSRHPWGSAEVVGLLCGSFGMFVVFGFWNNYKGEAAMIPPATIRITVVWASCLTIFFLFGSVFVVAYYLPLYFQGVRGDTPFQSGVHLLPTALTQVVFTLVSGRLVGVVGYYLPFMLVGGALNSIGSGLLTTLTTRTSMGKLIGFQLISGTGRGLALALPMIAMQAALKPPQIPTAMSTFVFCQNFGGALMTVIGQTIFTNGFKSELRSKAPTLNADQIVNVGSTAMRKIVSAADLPKLLAAYTDAVNQTFYLAVATAVLGFFVSYLMGWKDIRQRAPTADAATAA